MKVNEKLGVPEGINEQASKLYNELIVDLESYRKSSEYLPSLTVYNNNGRVEKLIGKYDIKIGELEIEGFPCVIDFNYEEEVVYPEYISTSWSNIPSFNDSNNNIRLISNYKISAFKLSVMVGKSSTKSDLVNVIKENINKSIIAHELMHLYVSFKDKDGKIEDTAEYESYMLPEFPPILSKFLHLLYFMSSTENIVRSTELYQSLLDNNVTKSDFEKFIEETHIMKMIKKAENFSLSEFKKDLENDDMVNDMINDVIKRGYKSTGSVSDDALNLLMINMGNLAIDVTREYLDEYLDISLSKLNPLERLYLMIGETSEEMEKHKKLTNKKFKQIVSKYEKYSKNYKKYFEYLEKKLNLVGNKMKKKLYKLYDMAEDDKSSNIANWELHKKINSKNEKLVYTLDFESFKKIDFGNR